MERVGGSRFEIVRRVGAGGMGVVYEARDRASGERLAIKTLHEHDATALYRLKKEFRGLQNVVHPNLIQFRELVEEDGNWFLVMEFVEGSDCLQYTRGAAHALGVASTAEIADATIEAEPEVPCTPPRDHQRVRSVIAQIASALAHLHATGRVHCDVKPSNVLVDRDGRAIVLDLGLARIATGPATSTNALAGTVPYISPEQVQGQQARAASDCYALGVVMFELLTGRWPFTGSAVQILNAKCTLDAPVERLPSTTPPDLARICIALLQRDPDRRPSANDVLRALAPESPAAPPVDVKRAAFFGREQELDTLRDALEKVRAGHARVVWVRGPSGVGKTCLVNHFLEQAAGSDLLSLTARCHERETVPFKAVDGIVDALTSFLRSRDDAEVASFLPRHISELCAAFPVLGRVPAIERIASESRVRDRDGDRRDRAFSALREMLTRLGERRLLVLFVDDLQWGDTDSMRLLREVLRPPDSPPVLLILTSREDAAVDTLISRLDADPQLFVRVDIQALDHSSATRLANHLIEEAGVKGHGLAAAIGTEAKGHPLHILELVQHAATAGAAATPVRLDDALSARIQRLPEQQRTLLRLVCVAGSPITPAVLEEAARQSGTRVLADVTMLTAANLLKSSGGQQPSIEPFHDRVRELVTSSLSPEERAALHHVLACALESKAPDAPGELLMAHFTGCNMLGRAASYAERAAREAEARLAYHRAAELYELALQHGEHGDQRAALVLRHALMLSAAGRPREAAFAFRTAAELADEHQRLDLERRSLEHLLIAGDSEEGQRATQQLLRRIRMRVPENRKYSIAALLIERARVRLRGRRFVERDDAELDARARERLDVLFSLAAGNAFIDPVSALAVQARFFREALDAGSIRRIVLASAWEMGFVGMNGPSAARRVEQVYAVASELAARLGDPVIQGMLHGSAAMCAYYVGDLRRGLALFDTALPLVKGSSEMAWLYGIGQTYRLALLWLLGRYRELMTDQARGLKEAEETGNVYNARSLLSWRGNHAWLVRDEPSAARAAVSQVTRTRTPSSSAQLADYYELLSNTLIDLYEADGETAHARIEGGWNKVRQFDRVYTIGIEATFARGCAAISVAHKQNAAYKTAKACARRLDARATDYSRMLSLQLLAAIAARQGHRAEATALLRRVIDACQQLETTGQERAARMRLATLDPDPAVQASAELAEAQLRDEGVVAPRRFANMLTPGLLDA